MTAAIIGGGGGWTRLRSVGRGASSPVVSLAANDASALRGTTRCQVGRRGSREAAAPARVERHVHVRVVLATRRRRRRARAVPGGSLADVVARNGSTVRAYMADALRGLDYLHGKLVVHGDVKGSNVVIDGDGRSKLATLDGEGGDARCFEAAGARWHVGVQRHPRWRAARSKHYLSPKTQISSDMKQPINAWGQRWRWRRRLVFGARGGGGWSSGTEEATASLRARELEHAREREIKDRRRVSKR
uniref:Protein kinase domain-containing protein n=1 Tax=Oryza punctata TaxID=4537 RepID=A0A0E0M574_ORYPU